MGCPWLRAGRDREGLGMAAYPTVGSTFGRYEVTGVLGQGGMGVVLSAVREGLGRKVALKVLSPDLAGRPDFQHRFEREASALARLYSPHIIDVYDYGVGVEDRDRPDEPFRARFESTAVAPI